MTKRTYRNSLLHLWCVVLVLALVSGCGSGAVKIEGTITLPDGSPIKKGTQIMYDDGKTSVVGYTNEQGKFALYHLKPGDGVPPGTYRGAIQYDGAFVPSASGAETAPNVPFSPKYLDMNTSGLTLTVESGKRVPPLNIALEK